ncbi:MAG: WD40/YVTN/BNR-like repeat-containing protein [Oceanococcus sp.]
MRPSRIGVLVGLMLPLVVQAQGVDSGDISPQPAEMMPLAAGHSMLLDVADTGKRFVAVGERGHVIGSLNGSDWVQVPTPVRAGLTAVEFADAENGWAVGHDAVIIRTRDGGRSWVLQNFQPELEKPFLDVIFLNSSHGMAVGAYSLMYVTHDGGDSWEEVDSPVREDEWHFNAITKLNNGALFIAGEAGTLAISHDNGEAWENLESPYSSSMFDATAVGENGVLIVGLRGNAFYTSDVSEPDWQKVDVGSESSLIGAAQLPNGEAVMVGINGVIFKTSNGVSSVEQIENSAGITLAGVVPVEGALVVVGEAGAQIIKN